MSLDPVATAFNKFAVANYALRRKQRQNVQAAGRGVMTFVEKLRAAKAHI